MEKVKIRQATKKGFIECDIGGVFNMAFYNSNKRRGRVIDNGHTAPTLDTGCQIGVVKACITPGRENIRQNGRRFKENGEPMFTLTAQDRHGVLIEPKEERFAKQARETLENNDCDCGDTINAFNKTVNKSGNAPTLTTRPEGFKTAVLPVVKKEGRLVIRKLTPKECFRLQGWPDEYFEKAAFVNSDSQLYKQAGNGVTVNVINEIAKRL